MHAYKTRNEGVATEVEDLSIWRNLDVCGLAGGLNLAVSN